MEDFERAMHGLSEKIYGQAGQETAGAAAGAASGSQGKGDEDIKDADFEVK
ncbi:MAG: hypothetical protein Fur0037_26890 [Planctomycetota bacterium]